MNTINKTLITGFLSLALVICGGGATKAYTPADDAKSLVYQPVDKIMVADLLSGRQY